MKKLNRADESYIDKYIEVLEENSLLHEENRCLVELANRNNRLVDLDVWWEQRKN